MFLRFIAYCTIKAVNNEAQKSLGTEIPRAELPRGPTHRISKPRNNKQKHDWALKKRREIILNILIIFNYLVLLTMQLPRIFRHRDGPLHFLAGRRCHDGSQDRLQHIAAHRQAGIYDEVYKTWDKKICMIFIQCQ